MYQKQILIQIQSIKSIFNVENLKPNCDCDLFTFFQQPKQHHLTVILPAVCCWLILSESEFNHQSNDLFDKQTINLYCEFMII